MAPTPAQYPASIKILFAFLSGILMGLAPAPINTWFLAWIALVPLWVLVVTPSNKSSSLIPHPSSFLPPLAWGIGYHGLALSWITGLHPLTWMGIPWLGSVAIALFAWVFITLWGAALVTLWAWAIRSLERFQILSGLGLAKRSSLSSISRVLIGTALWCGLESIWELGPLYWTSLSYTQSPGNLVILHLGQISGAMTVTAAIVACNGLLAEAWISYREWRSGGVVSPKVLHLGCWLLRSSFWLGCI